jgi:hypothetical protein
VFPHADDIGEIDVIAAIGYRSSVPFVDDVLSHGVAALIEKFNPHAARPDCIRLHDAYLPAQAAIRISAKKCRGRFPSRGEQDIAAEHRL